MKSLIVATLLTGLIGGMSSAAYAGSCPLVMKKIDAALMTQSTLSADQLAQVTELRAEGEVQHKSGSHAASIASLHEAMEILGLE